MRTQRRGFSLFELLVILALLMVLLGLFLPALFKARESAMRNQARGNLFQLALACHNYHDANNALPPGCDGNHFSAVAYLLPYVEQDALYRTIDFKKDITDKDNATARAAHVKVFLSPRDPRQSVNNEFGATNYLFNAGTKYSLKDNDGVFYLDSKLRLTGISDGTSNTIMIGETLKGDGGTKALDVKRQHVRLKEADLKGLTDASGEQDWKDDKNIAGDRCASWMDGRFLQGTFSATRLINDEKPDVDCGGAGGLSALRSLDRQVLICFCDASVRVVDGRKISMETWKALCTRAGGEAVNTNF